MLTYITTLPMHTTWLNDHDIGTAVLRHRLQSTATNAVQNMTDSEQLHGHKNATHSHRGWSPAPSVPAKFALHNWCQTAFREHVQLLIIPECQAGILLCVFMRTGFERDCWRTHSTGSIMVKSHLHFILHLIFIPRNPVTFAYITTRLPNFLDLFAFLVSRPPQSALLHQQAPTLLLNRWLACLTGSSILVLKLTFSPDPFPRNLPLSLTDWFLGFYPACIRKSLALKILVSAAD